MISILHLRKELVHMPATVSVAGVAVRSFVVPADIDSWLALRARATAKLIPGVRQWSQVGFLAEMVHQTWWREAWTWLAENESQVVGAVTLALRKGRNTNTPVVHWLLVDDDWRRRSIGRALISHLELAVWDAGWREVQVETHAGWSEAVAFYHSIGYGM
jgi:GNAT superfamily N-acetyltransferase